MLMVLTMVITDILAVRHFSGSGFWSSGCSIGERHRYIADVASGDEQAYLEELEQGGGGLFEPLAVIGS